MNWFWSYLTWDRGPRIIFGADESLARRRADRKTGQARAAS